MNFDDLESRMDEARLTALYRIYGIGESSYQPHGETPASGTSPYPWIPNPEETCPVCKDNLRLLTHPNDLKKHCSTYAHIAAMYDVDINELRRITKEYAEANKVSDKLINKTPKLDTIIFRLNGEQTERIKRIAEKKDIQPSKIIHMILNDALGIGLTMDDVKKLGTSQEVIENKK